MRQIYGPYKLTAGQQVQDDPTLGADGKSVRFKVKAVEQSFVVDESGRKWPISRQTNIHHDGSEHAMYRGDVKVIPSALVAGDEVELCHEVTYGAPDVPANLRKAHVKYTTFMSNTQLEKLNSHNAIKTLPAVEKAQQDEIAELRAEKARLLDELANLKTPPAPSMPGEPGKQNPQGQGNKQGQGKRDLQPA